MKEQVLRRAIGEQQTDKPYGGGRTYVQNEAWLLLLIWYTWKLKERLWSEKKIDNRRNRLSGRVFAIIIARDEGSCLEKRQLKNRACFVAHEGEIDNWRSGQKILTRKYQLKKRALW